MKKVEDLLGSWNLHRTMEFLSGEDGGWMSGKAVFKPGVEDNQLLYEENLTHHTLDGGCFSGFKSYIYRFGSGRIDIYFYNPEDTEKQALFLSLNAGDAADFSQKVTDVDQKPVPHSTFHFVNPHLLKTVFCVKSSQRSYIIKTVLSKCI